MVCTTNHGSRVCAGQSRDCANPRFARNISIRYVDNDYNVHEDRIGLFVLPNTGAETITSVVKDILLRCTLPIDLCRGQGYDGAAVMQGRLSGVAARIRKDVTLSSSFVESLLARFW